MWKLVKWSSTQQTVKPVFMEAGPSSSHSIVQFGFSESDGGVHQPSPRDAFSAMLKGVFRSALRVALKEIVDSAEVNNTMSATRAWKLLFFAAQDALVPTHTWGIGARQEVGGQIQTISQLRVDAVVG